MSEKQAKPVDLSQVPDENLAEELLKRGPKIGEMPYTMWLLRVTKGPGLSLELIIKDDDDRFLLTWRHDDDFRHWHFPGGLIHFREGFIEAAKRIAKEEVGVEIKNPCMVGLNNIISHTRVFENTTYETHFCGVVVVAELAGGQTPEDGEFFKEMPPQFLDCHEGIWQLGKSFLRTGIEIPTMTG